MPLRLCAAAVVVALLPACASARSLGVVNVPVTDVRAQPQTMAQPEAHDPLEETQLIYGEPVRILKADHGWVAVEALEQPEFTHRHRWQGYPGWVDASALRPLDPLLAPTIVVTEKWASAWDDPFAMAPSPWRFPIGTRLRASNVNDMLWRVELLDGGFVWIPRAHARSLAELTGLPVEEKRRLVVRNAELFLGDGYYWGGRSPRDSRPTSQATGVDCSGLVNLAYRAAGIDVPRDAHEQYLRARKVGALRPGDLVFLSERGHPSHIVHVMLYAGEDQLLEAPNTGLTVRRVTVQDRLGRPTNQLKPGTVVDGQTVFLGAYLP